AVPTTHAFRKLAKKHSDAIAFASVDATANPTTAAKYQHLKLPAVVTMEKKLFGMREKSQGEDVRPADARAHVAFLLGEGEDPAAVAARKMEKSQQKALDEATKDVSAKSFKREVLKSKIPVMVDFWAPWCGPCQQVSPIVEQLGEEYQGRVRVVKVNVDENESLSRKYNIMSIPTVMVFHQGAVVQTTHGAQPKRNYQRMLEQALSEG
ncbi:MAG: thioredoxin, partial [Chloroflexota bacterium]